MKKRKPIEFYTVWDRDICYITTDFIEPQIAEEYGFEEYIPDEKSAAPAQFYIEKPSKLKLADLKARFKDEYGITIKVKPYTAYDSERLDWKCWDGYKYGMKDCPEMEKISKKLIAEEECFKHLTVARIKYVYRRGKPTADANGRYELAHVEMAAKYAKYLKKYDFVMVTYESTWDMMHDWQKERLVFHELCHLKFKGSPSLVEHDIEEFFAVYRRYNVPIGECPYGELYEQVKLGIEQLEETEREEREYARKAKNDDGE